MLSERSDPLVVSFFYGTNGIALYQAGAKISERLRPVILTLSTQVYPLTTRFHVQKQQDNQRKTLILGTRYTFLMGTIASAGVILFSEQFSGLWLSSVLGYDYMIVARVMKLWAIANLFDYAAAMHWPALLGMKKLPFVLALQIPSAVFNVLVSIYLVGFTDWGIPGVLLATIITGAVRKPIGFYYVSRVTGLSIRKYISSAYLPPILLFFVLLAFQFVMIRYSPQNWPGLIFCMVAFTFYASMCLLLIERRLICRIYRKWRYR